MSDPAASCPRSRGGMALVAAFFATLCLALLARPAAGSDLRRSPIVKAVERARPSVVNIRGEKTLTSTGVQTVGGEAPRRVNGMGTGVVIDSRGYILTNYHVIDGVREIQVTLADERHFVATHGRPRPRNRPGHASRSTFPTSCR